MPAPIYHLLGVIPLPDQVNNSGAIFVQNKDHVTHTKEQEKTPERPLL